MPTTPEQIDLWRQSPSEHQRLEFKEAKQQFDNHKLHEHCVAIANEGGGLLLLGIADRPPRPVVGTQAFRDPISMAEKLFQAVGFRVDIEEVAHPDGRVLVFRIPARPRGTAYHLDGAYLMRSGEALVPMSEDQLRRIFAEGGPDWLEEYSRTALDAQGVIELLDTQTFFELLRLPYPTGRDGVIDRLLRERLVDQSDDGYAIRRLGALLLAKRLEDFPDLARKAPRVVVYTGASKLETRLDQVGVRGYAVGYQGLVDFVMAQLPQNEVIEDALRREVKLIPVVVVRELVANALVHQDLAMSGGPRAFAAMSREDRVRACFQHCALKWVMSEHMTNQTLRGRFHLPENKSAIISQVIAATIEAGLVKPDEAVGTSRKYARYLPFWA